MAAPTDQVASGEGSDEEIPSQVKLSFPLLLQAHDYAESLNEDHWEFAVEVQHLCVAGLTVNDLRWLACSGYVEHREETTACKGDVRTFQPCSKLKFSNRSCFALTPLGLAVGRCVVGREPLAGKLSPGLAGDGVDIETLGDGQLRRVALGDEAVAHLLPISRQTELSSETIQPTWDSQRRELRIEECLIKQFRLPSTNQERILMAFEEEGWPPRIDDPLSPHPTIDAKRRLHDTIKNLNRSQKSRLIRFKGDGTGQGVMWEQVAPVV